MKYRKNRFLYFNIIFIILLISGELFLRLYFGFCDSPLVIKSDNYEYINAPNQDRLRFRNHNNYNKYSMRSGTLDPDKNRILGLGDSVINGGAPTDQLDLATTLVSKETDFQLLNISAGSWGPDNCAAYISEKGLFKAKALVLVTSSHDAHDIMDFQPIVGVHPSYPSTQYKLAYWELCNRYLIPRLKVFFSSSQKLDSNEEIAKWIEKGGEGFNPGFDELKHISDTAKIPLLIYLHPELSEVNLGVYNDQGKEIISWAKKNNVYLFCGIKEGLDAMSYRDGMHLSSIGQRKLANSIKVMLEENNLK